MITEQDLVKGYSPKKQTASKPEILKGYKWRKVHPTAIVDTVVLPGVNIWHYTVVHNNAKIGKNTTIGGHCNIGPNVIIGEGCKIQNNVDMFDGVVLQDQVFVGPNVTFTNVKNPRAFVERKEQFKQTVVEIGATIGANATILPGVRIGAYSMIGAGAVVTKDVQSHSVWVGSPARYIADVCKCGAHIKEQLRRERFRCSDCQ